MDFGLKLASVPDDKYSGYRYEVIFKAYKWDPQVGDHNTISKDVVLMSRETAKQLEEWAEKLSEETMQMEEAFTERMDLARKLAIPGSVQKALKGTAGYSRENNVRLMRFDFHPTTTGWAISEVNSDVPGGLAEASVLPGLAGKFFEGYIPYRNVAESLFEAFSRRIKENSRIAFVHATSYADDRQVMQFLADYFEQNGYISVLTAPDHIRWKDMKAFCIIQGSEGEIDGIVRFFPLEWLTNLPKRSDWKGYYDTLTPSCNHPVAMFTQSKRLPLVWDQLGVDISAWKALLPETREADIKKTNEGWIFKPALGRVGEGISIREAITEKEMKRIHKGVRRRPKSFVSQRKFISQPLKGSEGEELHLNVGVFTVDGKCAGFYGRISPFPRIDDKAKDIPILISKEGNQNG